MSQEKSQEKMKTVLCGKTEIYCQLIILIYSIIVIYFALNQLHSVAHHIYHIRFV
mgnify:CR=1 FL=1